MSAFNIFEEIRAISWSDLPTWASAQDEGVHLDFKRKCEPHKADLDPEDKEVLSKALSGFANTEGGVLLVGVETESDKGIDRFTRLGPVCPLDQVTQRIAAQFANLTDPPIPALQVHQICDPENPTQGVVAIYVPASDGGPHRAMCGNRTKDRYFMRSTDATSPMPHSLLADRFGRAAKPRLSLRVWWQGGTATGQMLRIRLTNEGRGTARQPAIQVIVEGTLMQAMNFEIARMYTPQSEWKKRESRVAGKHAILLQSTAEVVVYPGLDFEVANAAPKVGVNNCFRSCQFRGFIYADGMQPVGFDHTFQPGSEEDNFALP